MESKKHIKKLIKDARKIIENSFDVFYHPEYDVIIVYKTYCTLNQYLPEFGYVKIGTL